MHRVSIWDVDYYYNQKGFNTDCMKISSFHKQRGDQVNFITTEYDINRPYDIIYIVKKSDKLQSPPAKFFDKRSRVWGAGFKYISNWKIPDVMLACRPDYLLYPNPSNQFERADMVQFFNDQGKLLGLTQNYENKFRNKKTLVIDRAFWKSDEDSIIFALDQLLECWNVAFLEPIWLSKVVCNKNIRQHFMRLEFTMNTQFKFLNDIGDDIESARLIIDFLKELKAHAPTTFVGAVNFAAISLNQYDNPENAWQDLERCLSIVALGKAEGFELKIQPLSSRLKTPYYTIFETISSWTQHAIELSLLEFIALPIEKQFNCGLEDVYRDNTMWGNAVFYEVLSTLMRHEELIFKYGLLRWGDNSLEIDKIDWNYLRENFKGEK